MDQRGPILIIVLCLYLTCASSWGEEVLSPTDVTSSPVDEIGQRRSTRPTQNISNEKLQIESRPISDSLNIIPGMQTRLNGSPTISIRGSQSSARTLVLTDGAPLNFKDGAGFNSIFIPTENLNSVTLLRGAASSLFGHDALSGAINFESEKLTRQKYYSSYGTFNTTQAFAGAPFQLGGVKTQITAYQTHTDGSYRTRNDLETVRSTITLTHTSDSVKLKSYNLIARQIGSIPGATDFPSTSSLNNWGELSHLGLDLKLSDSFHLGSRTTFKFLRQDYPSFGSPSETQSFHQGLSLTKVLGDHQLEIFDDLSVEQFRASYLGVGQSTDTLNEIGASDFYSINEILTVQPAIRFSNENGGIVPSLGLVAILDQWKVFANYTEGFHPPSISQKYTQSSQYVGNSSLSAEHSTEIDLGLERGFENQVNVKVEVFKRDIYNVFGTGLVSPGVSTTQNLGHSRATGFETSIDFENFGGSLSYLNNVLLDSNSPLSLSPRVQANIHLSKKIGPLSATLQDTYWSDYYDLNNSTGALANIPSWNTFDLFIKMELSKNLNIKFAALNLFDQQRQLTLNFPEPGRTFNLLLETNL